MAIKNKLITGANFRDFDWNKAKLFYHIAKCGSFLKAAQISGTDQSTLTRHVQALEKQIGFPLLIRQSTGITLTRKGEELLHEIAPFFLKMKGFCGNNHVEVGGEKKRKIRIASSHAIATHIITDLTIEYNKTNPHLVFEVIGNDDTLDVIIDDVDILIRPYDPGAAGIQQDMLFSLQKKLYASEEYLEKYGEPQTINDLKYHRLITVSSDAGHYPYADIHWILKLGMPPGKKHNPIFMSNSITSMIRAAQKGIGIIASYEIISAIKEANLKNILPDIKDKEIEEYFVYPDFLKKDLEIMKIKKYFKEKLSLSYPPST